MNNLLRIWFVCKQPFHYFSHPAIPPNHSKDNKRMSFKKLFFSKKVSWIRKRDLHILTVGILTYTNDQRFQSLHTEGSDEWTLKISSPQPRDSGTYECQVSTEPKISQAFRLNVVGKLTFNEVYCIRSCLAIQKPNPHRQVRVILS